MVNNTSSKAQVEVKDVCKSFTLGSEALLVLDHVSFVVYEGEFVSIVGPSGTGKTTLLNIIAGLEPADAGSVYVQFKKVIGPGPERGVIFQQYAVFPFLTVHDNIAFGLTLKANKKPAREREEIVQRYVDLVGLRGFENVYPKTLSGGMKQRVAIARAYAVSPDILLMDEPFAALDAQTREAMQEVVLDILERERKTVVFVTHNVEEAIFLSSRIVVMTSRPAQVREIVEVPFNYPRNAHIRMEPEFLKLRQMTEAFIREEYMKGR